MTNKIKLDSSEWPACFYPQNVVYDPDKEEVGLFRSEFLVRVSSSQLVRHRCNAIDTALDYSTYMDGSGFRIQPAEDDSAAVQRPRSR